MTVAATGTRRVTSWVFGRRLAPGRTLVGNEGGFSVIHEVTTSSAMPGLVRCETEHGPLYLDPDEKYRVLIDRAEVFRCTLSPDARAVIAGLVAPADDVHHAGIVAGDKLWQEIHETFPLERFQQWADGHQLADVGEDGDYYDPNAGE